MSSPDMSGRPGRRHVCERQWVQHVDGHRAGAHQQVRVAAIRRQPARTDPATVMAGCGGGGHEGAAKTASAAPTSSGVPSSTAPTSMRSRQAVLNQYRAFWAHLTSASLAPSQDRRAVLARYSADPELTSLLTGIAR